MKSCLSILGNYWCCVLFLFISSTTMAMSQDEIPPCPDNAEQIMVNAQIAITRGQLNDANRILQVSAQVIKQCPKRTHALVIAAELLAFVGKRVEDPDTQLPIFGAAYKAISQSEKAWRKDDERLVMDASGRKSRLYSYGIASKVLSEQIMPGLLRAAKDGAIHPMFMNETPTVCPYIHNQQNRVRSEAEGLLTPIGLKAMSSPWQLAGLIPLRPPVLIRKTTLSI